jgi:hypothetical protein
MHADDLSQPQPPHISAMKYVPGFRAMYFKREHLVSRSVRNR